MNRLKILLTTAMLAVGSTWLMAQPAGVKNVAKSVFTLTTFNADGSLHASSHGVFTSADGEAVSDLKPFLGAASAVVIDQKGNKMDVTRIIGVNDLYDMARFRVNGKTTPAPLASSASPAGSKAWLVGYALKNPEMTEATVKSVESFMGSYNYYIFSMNAPDNTTACPYVNESGEVIGLLQMSNTSFDTHAADARFAAGLSVNGLSYSDASIRQIGIPVALPADQQQAQLLLMMAAGNGDSKYEAAISDFMAAFPTLVDGYEAQARRLMSQGKFDEAAATMESAIKKAEPKDQVHFNYAKLIYDKEVYSTLPYEKWSLDKALSETQQAYAISPQPVYKHLQGQITFAKGEYQQAYDTFTTLYADKDFRTPELLYEAARCKEMLQAPAPEIIALLDSAINTTDTLRITEAAPYFLERAAIYEQADSFRQAVFDYTRYEYLMQGRVSANFYYIREQAEVKGRLYQQALADISRAIIMAPDEPAYYAELANLQLRVNMTEQAIQTAQRCTEVAPDYAEGFLLLGLAQAKAGDKTAGLANMQKAKELGSSQADALIAKYAE